MSSPSIVKPVTVFPSMIDLPVLESMTRAGLPVHGKLYRRLLHDSRHLLRLLAAPWRSGRVPLLFLESARVEQDSEQENDPPERVILDDYRVPASVHMPLEDQTPKGLRC